MELLSSNMTVVEAEMEHVLLVADVERTMATVVGQHLRQRLLKQIERFVLVEILIRGGYLKYPSLYLIRT
jgi:hypothetical protein